MTTASLQLAVMVVFVLIMTLITLAFSRIAKARAEAKDDIGAEEVSAIERELEIVSGIVAVLVIHIGFINCANAISSYL